MPEAAVLSWPHPPPLALSTPPSTINGSRFSTSPPASYARFRRLICTFTTTIGRPTTRRWLPLPRQGRETTIGGSRRFTRSTSPKATATSIYKPTLQVAVPRWSPDGKVDRLHRRFDERRRISRRRFVHDVSRRSKHVESHQGSQDFGQFASSGRRRIAFCSPSIVGGGSAISELSLANNSVRTIWKAPESFHAFGNFPNFALSEDGKIRSRGSQQL